MAKPIPLEIPPRDPRGEVTSRLQRAPMEHAEAILSAYDILQGLHDRGIFDLLSGMIGSSDKVLEIAVETAKTPPAMRAVRNLLVIFKTLGEIDPELFDGFALALPEAIVQARREGMEPPGFWAILNKFRSKDLRRGLVAVNSLLEAWGRDFFKEAHSQSK